MMIKLFLLGFSITACVYDLKSRQIPVLLFLIFGLTGMVLYPIYGTNTFIDELYGVIIGVVFIAISYISKGQLGMGDSLAILITGICQGGTKVAFSCIYALFAASIFSLGLMIIKRYKKDHTIPFIPFLTAGIVFQEIISCQ